MKRKDEHRNLPRLRAYAGRGLAIVSVLQDGAPELGGAFLEAFADPLKVSRIFLNYIRLVDQIADLSDHDLAIISAGNKIKDQMDNTPDGAAHNTAADVLQAMTGEQRQRLKQLVREAADPESEVFRAGLDDLMARMGGGHLLKEAGEEPTDGDPKWDIVIWGHTQLVDPEVLIEFTICHFLERFMTAAYSQEFPELTSHKDWFLNVVTDVIALNAVRDGQSNSIVLSWTTARADGGLGWVSEKRREAFETALRNLEA